MKIRNPWLINWIGFLLSILIRLWMGTLTYRMKPCEPQHHPAEVRKKRFIYAFWHETILFPTRLKTKAHVLISEHADGELIAQACRHFRLKTVRGSSTRNGTRALLQLVQVSQISHIVVTPDGPRGPRRKVQLGLIFLASRTGLPIVPCGVGYRKCWRFGSWDRFALPWPGTLAVCVTGQAIAIPPRLSRKQLEQFQQLVEQRMLEATEAAERLATGKTQPEIAKPERSLELRASA